MITLPCFLLILHFNYVFMWLPYLFNPVSASARTLVGTLLLFHYEGSPITTIDSLTPCLATIGTSLSYTLPFGTGFLSLGKAVVCRTAPTMNHWQMMDGVDSTQLCLILHIMSIINITI